MPPDNPSKVWAALRTQWSRLRVSATLPLLIYKARGLNASKLLTYVVEQDLAGRSKDLKEYTVAVELFNASADYDSKIDSLVRVNANRLRFRLEEYYASDPLTGHLPHPP
jgi:hypothetical protein